MELIDILQEYRIPHETEGRYSREGWIQLNCPFCFGGSDPDKLYLGYNIAGKYFNCWRCGNHRIVETILRLTNAPLGEVVKLTRQLDHERVERIKRQGRLELPKRVLPMTKAHRNYLEDRRFNPVRIEKLWNIQGIGVASKLAWRLFIPITMNGETVSWTTRTISDSRLPRYISASLDQESVPHKTLLYGEEFTRRAVVVCEGPMDVWRIGPGAVCTFGVELTSEQIERISRYPVRYFCFDNEPAAQRMARRYVDELSVFDGRTSNIVLDAKDPGEAPRKEIMAVRKLLD